MPESGTEIHLLHFDCTTVVPTRTVLRLGPHRFVEAKGMELQLVASDTNEVSCVATIAPVLFM